MKALLMIFVSFLMILFSVFSEGKSSKHHKLLIVITSVNNRHHLMYADLMRSYLYSQINITNNIMAIEIVITEEEWPDLSGAWTIFPIISEIGEVRNDVDWVLFVQEITEVRIVELLDLLTRYSAHEPHFLGRALRDHKPTVIHHYSFDPDSEFAYPDFSSGFLLSRKLIEIMALRLGQEMTGSDFSIDPKHEIAKFIYQESKGLALTDLNTFFCAPNQMLPSCVTHYDTNSMLCPESSIHSSVPKDSIFVMVKTCEAFHKTRVPLQHKLWTKKLENVEYCSETLDRVIPTIKLDVQNTVRGHCGKLYAMLKRAYTEKHISSKAWLVLVDDDTIMSVDRLRKLLTCYNPTDGIALGERYGYGVRHGGGYDYITGGGGIILSSVVVKKIIESGVKCYTEDSPDDMMLGMWLRQLGIPVIHSALFHQAPPSSYSPEYLEHQRNTAISFHKFEDDNPETVARDWLGLVLSPRDEL